MKVVRLHLGLSLNHLCPAAFLLSHDRAPTSTERTSLLALVKAGVTHIADRGYVSLPLYGELMEARAFFVIRERYNLRYRVLAALDLSVDGLVTAGRLRVVQDAVIQLTRGEVQTVLRRVDFCCGTHRLLVVTNRWNLTTAQIIRLYAWRWQVEEMFSDHKNRGLNLEATRLSDPDRLERLLVAVVLAYFWIMEVEALIVVTQRWRQVDNRGYKRSVSLCQIGLRWFDERHNEGRLPPLFSGSFRPLSVP